ncbi:MAG: EF-hand domain-containing protein [Hyphomicrobiales bacterium]|nr:EF-hand domain-containing protein [Hyphomicrobiales bacterium]MBV9754174.1 EF-hand domain-containing protein [Hyphomicrobiales bacterium]
MFRASCFALSGLLFLSFLSAPLCDPAMAASRAMHILDTDKDGTIDTNEANAAASALFDQLDRDRDGTLTMRELHGRLNSHEFKMADTDHDGTLSKDEYLALVADLFKRADHDGEGTLDEHELRSPAGRKLQKLLRR